MAEQHTILGGKVYVYKRSNSSRWQCSSFFAGKNRRTSTKEESLAKAKEIAEDSLPSATRSNLKWFTELSRFSSNPHTAAAIFLLRR